MPSWNPSCERWLDATLPQILPVQKRKLFGYPAWFEYGRMRLCLIETGLGIKSDPGVIRSVKDSGVPLKDFTRLGRDAGKSWTLFALTPAEGSWDEDALRFALGLLLSVPVPEGLSKTDRRPR